MIWNTKLFTMSSFPARLPWQPKRCWVLLRSLGGALGIWSRVFVYMLTQLIGKSQEFPAFQALFPSFGWAREDLGQSPRNGRELYLRVTLRLYLPSLSCLCEEDMFTLVSLYLCLSLSMCLLCIIVTSIGLYLSVLYLSPSISLYLSVFYLSPCIYIAIYQLYLSSLSYLCEEDICKCMSISLSFFSLSISIHIFIHLSLHLFTCRLYYLPFLYICEKGIWLMSFSVF